MEKRAKPITDVRVVSTSLAVNASDTLLNIVIAFVSGSTVMLSQALQGISDLATTTVLYKGVRKSKRQADLRYQFGYGREVFFWVLMGGIFMFMGTGLLSFYFGYQQLIDPQPVENVAIALIVLAFGLVTNGYALSLSMLRLHRTNARMNWYQQLMNSSIVETKATMITDLMGSLGPALGLVALGLYQITGNAQFDGLGSMFIGATMAVSSLLLIRDVRALIVGRAVDDEVASHITKVAESVDGIQAVLDLRTMYLGSAKLLVIIEAHVADGLETDQIEEVIDTVKDLVTREVPEVHHIQIELETPDNELLSTGGRRRKPVLKRKTKH